jgi:hypothetical protein
MKNQNVIISVLATCVILMGLFIIYLINNQASQIEPIVSDNKISFDKQKTCSKYRESAQKKIEESYNLAQPYFHEIFYSPTTDTCLIAYGIVLAGVAPNDIGSFVIEDYFSNKELFSVNYDNTSENEKDYSYEVRRKYTEALNQFKE